MERAKEPWPCVSPYDCSETQFAQHAQSKGSITPASFLEAFCSPKIRGNMLCIKSVSSVD